MNLPYTLPEMTMADVIIYLDYERIPEALADIDLLKITDDTPASYASFVQEKKAKRAGLLEDLALLQEWYEAFEISADTYERLTTPQNYSGEHLQALSDHVAHFIPRSMGNGHKGAVYCLLGDNDATIWLRYENEQWIRCDDDPYGKNS